MIRVVALLSILPALGCATWVTDPVLRAKAALRQQPHALPVVSLDLDLPPLDRWIKVATPYKSQAQEVVAYLKANVPAWALPLLEKIGKDIYTYFGDYGEEMSGLAHTLGLKLGDVVLVNLVMQLESIGLNCSNWNNTGPTVPNDPGCMAEDPTQAWCYCHDHKHNQSDTEIVWFDRHDPKEQGPGACTSTVAQQSSGDIVFGRNLDWDVPPSLRKMMVDVMYTRNNATVFRGTTVVGFVGVLNGMVEGKWAASLNARGKGGKILTNMLEMLREHGRTPAQHLRKALETAVTFAEGVKALQYGDMIDECYFTVGGATVGEGCIVTRDRKQANDTWCINSNSTEVDADGWYRFQTNYDHWNPVPVADDRRSPGYAMMNAMGQGGVTVESITTVMKTFPVFNHHTDYTAIMVPANNTYLSYGWW